MLNPIVCSHCGSGEFIDIDNARVCAYCRSSFKEETLRKGADTTISVKEDVERLLNKCRKDPRHASRYAELVLDIDPFNKEAMTYL